jgi:hypothetical protein
VVEAAVAGFEMAVLQMKISCFSRLRVQRGGRVRSVYTLGEFLDICASLRDDHQAKRGRGRLRDGGAPKENMCFFPGEGFKGVGGFKVFILSESFWFLKYTREGVRADR